ncbi:holliday junction DNA helicase RuvA [bacterium endosymbiont of Mortierella elongata FMR23-6]|nr:holliday junction DNA helicase RuvA [bacterium endosymbiont of Mortierella elongata FMR23-6]
MLSLRERFNPNALHLLFKSAFIVVMIGRIAGILLEKNPPHLLIDCHGIGYEIDVPMSTFYTLPAAGESVVLLTQLLVREDAHLLYGFATAPERSTFRELLKISGIGARMALAVLSGMSVNDLAQAVTAQDTALFTRIPGIGKKTAERLLLELKGKLGVELGAVAGHALGANAADTLNALLALGYSEKEALLAIKNVPAGASVSDGIKLALKALSKT